jgi:hypothetical protein
VWEVSPVRCGGTRGRLYRPRAHAAAIGVSAARPPLEGHIWGCLKKSTYSRTLKGFSQTSQNASLCAACRHRHPALRRDTLATSPRGNVLNHLMATFLIWRHVNLHVFHRRHRCPPHHHLCLARCSYPGLGVKRTAYMNFKARSAMVNRGGASVGIQMSPVLWESAVCSAVNLHGPVHCATVAVARRETSAFAIRAGVLPVAPSANVEQTSSEAWALALAILALSAKTCTQGLLASLDKMQLPSNLMLPCCIQM